MYYSVTVKTVTTVGDKEKTVKEKYLVKANDVISAETIATKQLANGPSFSIHTISESNIVDVL